MKHNIWQILMIGLLPFFCTELQPANSLGGTELADLGISITVTGGHVVYSTDSEGNTLYDEDGSPIPLYVDCEGNPSGLLVEVCNAKTLIVSAEELTAEMTINLDFGGNAVNGIDYFYLENGISQPLPESMVLGPDQLSINYDIFAEEDGAFEGLEFISLEVTSIDAIVFEENQIIDTIRLIDNVLPFAQASAFNYGPFCSGISVPLDAFGAESYDWFPPEFLNDPSLPNPVATITENVIFGVALTNGPCIDTLYLEEMTVYDASPPTVIEEYILYDNDPISLSASNAGSYSWFPSTNLSCIDCPNPVYIPDGINATYQVEMFYISGCYYGIETVEIIYEDPPTLNLAEPIVLSYSSEDSLSINYAIADSLIGAIDILWDFGDGTFSEEASGIHTYEMDGVYEIELTLKYLGTEYAFKMSVIAGQFVGINAPHINTVKVYPNPNPSQLILEYPYAIDGHLSYKIYNKNGKLIQYKKPVDLQNSFPINTLDYSSGLYFLVLELGETTLVEKFIIDH